MSKKMKLNLESIRIKSFVTTLSSGEKVKAKGAGDYTPTCTSVTCIVECTQFGCPTEGCTQGCPTEGCPTLVCTQEPTGLPDCPCGVGTVP